MSLAVHRLTKRYGGVTVLDHVDLSVEDGEIHALLGANGAGKSTLIKCVSGAITPDDGEIVVAGETYRSVTPREAYRAGVAVIYQELSVINTLNVGDNLFLGDERTRGFLLRRRAQRSEAREWLHRLGVDLNTRTLLSSMSSAELQVVEIVKALRREPAVLILDEPTAALSEAEVVRLGGQMRMLRSRGLPLLFVTHRISEVFQWADRVTVLRGGRVVLSSRVAETDRGAVVAAITNRAADRPGAPQCAETRASTASSLLRVRGLLGPGIGPLDLDVDGCEVLGVFGLVGSGRTELLETLFGARPMRAGRIEVGEQSVHLRDPADAVAAGIALVPSDRLRKSLFLDLRAYENVLFPSFSRLAHRGTWRNRGTEGRVFAKGADQTGLQPPRPKLDARRFSGGNQQKLILSRWLQTGEGCKVMLLDEPTQGVDVGARGELYRAVREFAQGGRAVVLTSSEPEELIQVANRVLVLSRGHVVGVLEGDQVTEAKLVGLAHFGESSSADLEEMAEANEEEREDD